MNTPAQCGVIKPPKTHIYSEAPQSWSISGSYLRVELRHRTSWLSNFGQLRRSTDRNTTARLGQFALAVALIITVKLFKWADRWNHT